MNIKMMLSRAGMILKKNSPIILTVTGVVGLTAAGVVACVQSTKVDKVIERHKNRIEDLHDCKDDILAECGAASYRGSLVRAYTKTVWDFTKLYGIPLVLAAGSITAILCGHNIISKRHAALSVAYDALNTAFGTYRDRVRQDVGEEKEMAYYTGKTPSDPAYDKNAADPDHIIKEFEKKHTTAGLSPYSRFFDEQSSCWKNDPLLNKNWVIGMQNWANNLLKTRGHVFLNEVYEALGFPHTPTGALVGWVLTDDGSTDNVIDFGLYNDPDGYRKFIDEREKNILLDFNVHGPIYNLI